MYSPPATASGTKYDRTSPTHSNNNTHSHSIASSHDQQPPHKLPSLPPFPSLVSSLGEGRPPQDYPLNSSSKQTASTSPSSSHRESSILPPPPTFYPNNHQHHHRHLAPPSSQQYHHNSQQEQRRPSENDSATRSSWEPSSDRLLDPRIRTDNTTTSPSAEDRKPNLPLSSSRGSSIPFRSSSNLPFSNHNPNHKHNMSGQQVEWESSIRTGSSASNSEAPLSPSHSNAKRRRLSAAHDIVHGSASAEELHDDDDQHSNHQIDELLPNIGGGGGHSSSHLQSHSRNNSSSNTIMMMNESASPPGGAGGGDGGNNSDEKGANGRTLKQTKRAAQNRAAQQAFRKRKEERIRELEEKEKVLSSLVARENEIVRREKILAERERLSSNSNNATSPLGLPQNGSSESSGGRGGPSATTPASGITSTTNDWDRAFASAPVASPVQHIAERLESSNRTNDLLKLEIDTLNKSLMDKIALVESLRRSLEDLGAENRNLRDALGRSSASLSSLHLESSRHPHQHSQPQQYSQQHNPSQQQQSQQPQQHSRASS